MEVTQKIKLELPYDPAISLLGIYPKEIKTGYQRNICTTMFTAASFTMYGNNLSVRQQMNG